MKPISNDFKEALKSIKQIDAIISYADKENTNFIITQNSEMLLTEASDYLVTESAEVIIDNGGIQNCSISWKTDLLKSVCKMLNLETSRPIEKETEINVKVGLLVDDEYEYVDYGKFYTTEDSSYQLGSGTYVTTAYDRMIRFNIKAIDNPITFVEGVEYSLKTYLETICNKCGVPYAFDYTNISANANVLLFDTNPYENRKNVTYRDIIDDIAQCLGTNFIINADNKITNKETNTTSVMTIDADILKDSNVYIGEKKDGIDGIQVYDGSAMINYTGASNSVIKIKDNNIMSAYSEGLLNNVLPLVYGFSYYMYNLETFGIFALEPFDCFTVTYNNTNYLLCSFKNDIKITGGVEEEISYDFNELDSTSEYTTSSSKDGLSDALIEIDKANGQIVLKAKNDGSLVQAELKADASEGSSFNVKADNINFDGKTFNLTTDNMAITSTNFSVDKDGNMTANSGTFGGSINTGQNCTVGNNLYVGQNQATTAVDNKFIYFNNDNYIRRAYSGLINTISMISNQQASINVGENRIFANYSDYVRMETATGGYFYISGANAHTLNQIYVDSDKRLKEKIKDIDVSWIDELKVKEYEHINCKGKKQIGLIAQDYEDKKYSKYFLTKNNDDYYSIQYGNITNALIQYCQELKKEVQELKQEIEVLKNEK